MNPTLNIQESTVLIACIKCADAETGGDFGFTEKVHQFAPEFTKHQIAGYLSSLQAKKYICIDDEYGQFEIADRVKEAL